MMRRWRGNDAYHYHRQGKIQHYKHCLPICFSFGALATNFLHYRFDSEPPSKSGEDDNPKQLEANTAHIDMNPKCCLLVFILWCLVFTIRFDARHHSASVL